MNWSEAAMDDAVDSRLAADRFVTGALRRIRVRTKLEQLMWMEAKSPRPVVREMEERFSLRE
jgi:hypothetical protein